MLADLQNQLGIDATIGVQFLIFFGLYLWLRFVFFGPFLNLLDARHLSTQGLREKALDLEVGAEEKEKQYSERMAAVRRAAAVEREKILAEARASSAGMIEAARKSSKEQIEAARIGAEAEAKGDLDRLSAEVSQLSDLFVKKLTNTGVRL